MMRALWNDEGGFIVSTELVLVATILVIAMVVGLSTVRDAVLTELVDLAHAIGQISQSYSYNGVSACNGATAAGSFFVDASEPCDSSIGNATTAPGISLNVGPGGG
jgi:Flp pilus assembly pilin Flp